MNLMTNLLFTFLIGIFLGYFYRSYKLKHQLLDPVETKELLEEYGFIRSNLHVSYIVEILLKILIIALIASAIYFSVYKGISEALKIMSQGYMQILIFFLAGFIAGYVYRSYKLKFQLMTPETLEKLYMSYGFIKKPEAYHFIDSVIKLIIIILIILVIYFSVYGA